MQETEIAGITFTECIGFIAMLGVLISFLMKDIRNLRLINTAGCLFFVAYGFLLNISWPIIVTNMAIVIINLFYLLKPKT